MDLLEQPLEAVAFRAYFLPEVAAAGAGAAAWTCLAAVIAAAAAAGLWRLRSSTPHAVTEDVKPLDLEPRSAPTPPHPERTSETSSAESTSSSAPAPPSPRERYTAYYYYYDDDDSGCVGCCDVEGDDEEDHQDLEDDDGVYGPPPSETDPFDWQMVGSLPIGAATTAAETAPYRSPRALSSSVVRLWDQGAEGGLTAAASPRRRGIIVAGVGTVSPF